MSLQELSHKELKHSDVLTLSLIDKETYLRRSI